MRSIDERRDQHGSDARGGAEDQKQRSKARDRDVLKLSQLATAEAVPPRFGHWLKVAFAFAIAATTVWVVYLAREALLVVAASLMLAIGLGPLLDWFEAKGWSRNIGMATAILAGIVLFALTLVAIGPPLLGQVAEFGEALPSLIQDVRDAFPYLFDGVVNGSGEFGVAASDAMGSVSSSISSAAGFFLKASFVLVLAPYLAVALPSIIRAATRLFPHNHREEFIRSVNASTKLVGNYILGNLVVSVVAGAVTFVGLTLLDVPFALALAVWVALVDAIPAIGATLGALPALFVAATVGAGTLGAVVAFFILYQQVENHLIVPSVMKRAVLLGPATVIMAILIGGTLAGVFGVLLAVPLTATLKVAVFDRLLHDRILSVSNGESASNRSKTHWWRPGGKPGSRPLP